MIFRNHENLNIELFLYTFSLINIDMLLLTDLKL